ncbi:uncharacterized protein ACIBXB_001392 isoform 1-T1 [Morphnus guianensis]
MRPWASPTRVMMKLRRKKKIWMSCALAKASTTMPGRTGWPASPIHPSIPGLRVRLWGPPRESLRAPLPTSIIKLLAALSNCPKGGGHSARIGANVILPWDISIICFDLFPECGLSAYQQPGAGVYPLEGRISLRAYRCVNSNCLGLCRGGKVR